jgi:hypothetical protein
MEVNKKSRIRKDLIHISIDGILYRDKYNYQKKLIQEPLDGVLLMENYMLTLD